MNRLGKFFLVTYIFGLSFLAIEEAVNYLKLVDFPLYTTDNDFGYRVSDNQSGIFMRRNSWSFQENGLSTFYPDSSSDKVILIVGDSVVLGGNQIDNHYRLGSILSLYKESKVISAAAGSWSLLNEISFVKKIGIDLSQFSTVVFVLNSEDFGQPSIWKSELSHPTHHPLVSSIYLFMKYIYPRPPAASVDTKSPRQWTAEWPGLLASIPGKVIVVSYPTKRQLTNPSERIAELAPAIDTLRALSGDRVQILDVAADARWNASLYSDNIHPTRAGNQVLGAIIADASR
jgi:hypothetical protein